MTSRSILGGLALFVSGLLGACTAAPSTKSPLLPNVAEIRGLEELRVEIFEYDDPLSLGVACLSERDPITVAVLTITQGPLALIAHRACAKVGKTWCRVHVPRGDQELLDHELDHCRGYADDPIEIEEASARENG